MWVQHVKPVEKFQHMYHTPSLARHAHLIGIRKKAATSLITNTPCNTMAAIKKPLAAKDKTMEDFGPDLGPKNEFISVAFNFLKFDPCKEFPKPKANFFLQPSMCSCVLLCTHDNHFKCMV